MKASAVSRFADPNKVAIYEVYKISDSMPATILRYGNWTGTDLMLPKDEIWQRRHNLNVSSISIIGPRTLGH